ncbi:MAG: phosphotransferase [Alphaproteobacteria bacterium]|nr:phosphotransferase [Alphaproteobacteria bacterium]
MSTALHDRIRDILQIDVVRTVPLSGGCIGDVRAVELSDGTTIVVKSGGDQLALEGWMLQTLSARSALPVPAVLHCAVDLLLMSNIETSGGITASAEQDAADHLAALHAVSGDSFGLERNTVIGGVHQPNPPMKLWLPFFAEHRLLHMAVNAHETGRLPAELVVRVEALCGRLSEWLDEPRGPSLIHGDMWTGNVLCNSGRISGFVDPAIYYADPEIELAFATLFNTFGDAFFARYNEHRPIADGFFEERRDLYNLYPLLVHVRLFGGSYVNSVDATLRRFGA